MNTFKLTFDLIEFDKELLSTFHSFGLKLTKYYDIGNCDVVEFEGTKNQLKKWYNESDRQFYFFAIFILTLSTVSFK